MSLFIGSHDIPASALTGSYDPLLVALSFLVASVAAYVAIDIVQWIRVHDAKNKLKGISVGALVMGAGIWSMHFIGMLAYHIGLPHTYDPLLTALSMVIVVLFSWGVFFNNTREKLTVRHTLIGAPLMGVGISVMHYVGMAAMVMPAKLYYLVLPFTLSIIIAIIASAVAMTIMRAVAAVKEHHKKLQFLAALILGAGVCGMHYTGMVAAVVVPEGDIPAAMHHGSLLFGGLVALVSFLVIFGGYFFLQKKQSTLQEGRAHLDHISLAALAVVVGGLLFFIYEHSEQDLVVAAQHYREKSNAVSEHEFDRFRSRLNMVYTRLDTISKLSGVRAIDPAGDNISPEARASIQVIYDGLSEDVDLTEIYIVPKNIDVEAEASEAGGHKSIVEFDSHIVDADGKLLQSGDEIYEYRAIQQQMSQFPQTLESTETASPFSITPELITCDNRVFNLTHEDKDRQGIVLSVPFYGPDNNLKGAVAAIIRTSVLSSFLRDGDHVLIHKGTHVIVTPQQSGQAVISAASVHAVQPDPALIYSEVLEEKIGRSNDVWMMWAGLPDKRFYGSEDVQKIRFSHRLAYAVVTVLALFILIGMRISGRYTRTLYDEKQKLSTVLKTVMEGIIAIDENGIVTHFNSAAENIFDYRAVDVVGNNISMLMPEYYAHNHDGYLHAYKVSGQAKIIGSGRQVEGKRRDGSVFPMELSVNVMRDDSGRMSFVGSIRDITARVRLQENLLRERDRAEEAVKSQSRFLANMSHEIRTPMNGIIGVVGLLDNSELSERQRECVDIIGSSSRTLLVLINEILDYSKIDAEKVIIENSAFNLISCVMEQIQLLQPLAMNKGLYLNVNMDGGIPSFISGDPLRFRQVLLNIIGNALKFTSTGGVTVAVDRLPAQGNGILVKVAVTDTGRGIPKDKLGELFEPFYQVSSGTTKDAPGTGLGLTISKKLIGLMGGDIQCDSELGVGTTFSFTVQFSLPTEAQIAEEIARQNQQAPEPTFGSKHVLIVEDTATNQFVIKKVLKALNCTFDVAVNGQEAVAYARAGGYDAILMDCHMPVMDGYEATQIIRSEVKSDVLIIALTANASREDQEHCLNVGMNDFVSKPFTKTNIVLVFNKWFGGKQDA